MLKPSRGILTFTLVATVVLGAVAARSNRNATPTFDGDRGNATRVWQYSADARQRCWLRLQRQDRPVIRVNCFAVDGVLYTHSNRFVPVARMLGKSWTQTVEQHPALEVLIEDKVYALNAVRTKNEEQRKRILVARHYSYIPDGIQVYALQSE